MDEEGYEDGQPFHPIFDSKNSTKGTIKKFTGVNSAFNIDRHNEVTYKLLNRDMTGQNVLFDAEERVGQELERIRQEKILERIEFEKQIERFTQKELLKAIQKKEALKANKEYWN